MSTIPPTPSFNKNVPVLTSSGGTSAAYKNPNSPESILKKTVELQAQASVDSKFDVNQSPYHEPFSSFGGRSRWTNDPNVVMIFFFGILSAYLSTNKIRLSGKLYMLSIAVLLIFLVIYTYSRNDRGSQ